MEQSINEEMKLLAGELLENVGPIERDAFGRFVYVDNPSMVVPDELVVAVGENNFSKTNSSLIDSLRCYINNEDLTEYGYVVVRALRQSIMGTVFINEPGIGLG